MSIQISKPSSILAPYVRQYWMVKNTLTPGNTYTHRVIPNGLMELSFYLGKKPKMINEETVSVSDSSLVTGQVLKYHDIEVSENLDLFSITFQPHGAMMFFNIPLADLKNQTISWRLFSVPSVQHIEEQLYDVVSFNDRIKVMERYLVRMLPKCQGDLDFERMKHCLNLVNQKAGKVAIDHMADETCLSRKQFERIFIKYIGTTPKQFLKVVRFQNAIFHKQNDINLELTGLAHHCGYYDQSHMINDFKRLSGRPPSEFFSECKPYSDYFSF